MSIGGTRFHVRLTQLDGALREWDIAWPGGDQPPVEIPAGVYLFEAWTIYTSDEIMCAADPAAPGGRKCRADESSTARCQVPAIVVHDMTSVRYSYSEAGGECEVT